MTKSKHNFSKHQQQKVPPAPFKRSSLRPGGHGGGVPKNRPYDLEVATNASLSTDKTVAPHVESELQFENSDDGCSDVDKTMQKPTSDTSTDTFTMDGVTNTIEGLTTTLDQNVPPITPHTPNTTPALKNPVSHSVLWGPTYFPKYG